MDFGIVSTFWLLQIMSLWTFVCKLLHKHMFSVLLGVHLGGELLARFSLLWGYLCLIQYRGRGMAWMTPSFLWTDGSSTRQPPGLVRSTGAVFSGGIWITEAWDRRQEAWTLWPILQSCIWQVAVSLGCLLGMGIGPLRKKHWSRSQQPGLSPNTSMDPPSGLGQIPLVLLVCFHICHMWN